MYRERSANACNFFLFQTDDKGVFSTSLSQEYRLCSETFKLTPAQLAKLSLDACQYVFAEDERSILNEAVLKFIVEHKL